MSDPYQGYDWVANSGKFASRLLKFEISQSLSDNDEAELDLMRQYATYMLQNWGDLHYDQAMKSYDNNVAKQSYITDINRKILESQADSTTDRNFLERLWKQNESDGNS